MQDLARSKKSLSVLFVVLVGLSTLSMMVSSPMAEARDLRLPLTQSHDAIEIVEGPLLQIANIRRPNRAKRLIAKPKIPVPTVPILAAPAVSEPTATPASPLRALADDSGRSRFPDSDTGRLQLVAGPLKALVHQEAGDKQPAPGETVYASILVQGSGAAEILVEAENGTLQPLLGTRLTTGPKEIGNRDAGQIARFDLGTNGQTALTIELMASAAGRPRLRFTLTALNNEANSPAFDSTTISWQRSDCASDYYQSLKAIGSQRLSQMARAVETVLAPDAISTGRWQFGAPSLSVAAAPVVNASRRRCLDLRIRQDYLTGQQTKICRRWKDDAKAGVAPGDATTPAPAADEPGLGEIVRLADIYVKSKLSIRAFERKKVLRLKSFDLLNSLRNYLEQPPHPALCTGTDQMLDYYVENTTPLSDSISRIERVAAAAADLARQRVAALTGKAVADGRSDGTPQTTLISAAVAAPATAPNAGGNALFATVLALSDYVLAAGDLARVKQALTARQAFAALAERLLTPAAVARTASTGAADLPDNIPPELLARRAAAAETLSLVEAAIVLDGARERFLTFKTAGYGTVDAIRAAHKQHCTCTQ